MHAGDALPDGRVLVGCNVENAAYGVTLCAECGLVSQLHATGGGLLVAVYCVGADLKRFIPIVTERAERAVDGPSTTLGG